MMIYPPGRGADHKVSETDVLQPWYHAKTCTCQFERNPENRTVHPLRPEQLTK